jgi:hypothetical protein
MKKLKKLEPYTPEWNKLANIVARNFAPPIRPCRECGYPVVDGYCCGRCGSTRP